MQSSERARLVRSMSGPLSAGRGTLLSCAVGLAVLVMVLVLGPQDEEAPGTRTQIAAASRPFLNTPIRQEAHRRQVMAERRATYRAGSAPIEPAAAAIAGGSPGAAR